MLGDSAVLSGGGGDAPAAAAPPNMTVEGGGGGVGSNSESDVERGRVEDGERSFGGNRWPRQETLALLRIRSDMDTVFRDASVKGPLWDEVSRLVNLFYVCIIYLFLQKISLYGLLNVIEFLLLFNSIHFNFEVSRYFRKK